MRVVVARAEEIAPGERKIVDVGGRSIGVFNVDGEFFALRNRCPHQGGALCEGILWGLVDSTQPGEFQYEPRREMLACPWHGWEFHIRTGQSWCAPERLAVRSYEVEVVSSEALGNDDASRDSPVPGMVKGPYVAETYDVHLEGEVLVIEVPSAGARRAIEPDGAESLE